MRQIEEDIAKGRQQKHAQVHKRNPAAGIPKGPSERNYTYRAAEEVRWRSIACVSPNLSDSSSSSTVLEVAALSETQFSALAQL
jgi:hypothetical protein